MPKKLEFVYNYFKVQKLMTNVIKLKKLILLNKTKVFFHIKMESKYLNPSFFCITIIGI